MFRRASRSERQRLHEHRNAGFIPERDMASRFAGVAPGTSHRLRRGTLDQMFAELDHNYEQEHSRLYNLRRDGVAEDEIRRHLGSRPGDDIRPALEFMNMDIQESGEFDERGQTLYNVRQRGLTEREVRRTLGASPDVDLDEYRMPQHDPFSEMLATRLEEERLRQELVLEREMMQMRFENQIEEEALRYEAARQAYGAVLNYAQPPSGLANALNLPAIRGHPASSTTPNSVHSSITSRPSPSSGRSSLYSVSEVSNTSTIRPPRLNFEQPRSSRGSSASRSSHSSQTSHSLSTGTTWHPPSHHTSRSSNSTTASVTSQSSRSSASGPPPPAPAAPPSSWGSTYTSNSLRLSQSSRAATAQHHPPANTHSRSSNSQSSDHKLSRHSEHSQRSGSSHHPSRREGRNSQHETRECIVCVGQKRIDDFPRVTEECTHQRQVCLTCLQRWLETTLNRMNWNHLQCPSCEEILQHADMRRIATPEVFTQYDDHATLSALSTLPNFRWCISPTCTSGQEHNVNTLGPQFQCNACGRRACATHNVTWHESETCAQYEHRTNLTTRNRRQAEEEASEELMVVTTERCPGCQARILRNGGCEHMTCTRCRYEFCWACLADYSLIRERGRFMHRPGCAYGA